MHQLSSNEKCLVTLALFNIHVSWVIQVFLILLSVLPSPPRTNESVTRKYQGDHDPKKTEEARGRGRGK